MEESAVAAIVWSRLERRSASISPMTMVRTSQGEKALKLGDVA
jgi:hypothetical protein